MKLTVGFAVLLVAAMAAGSFAQNPEAIVVKDWPYCPCTPDPVAYHLNPIVKFKGNSTYCFTVEVNPPIGCSTYCCSKADLKKLEIDANAVCKVGGLPLKGWVNGVPSRYAPTVERSAFGPPGTFILKLTGLGLTLDTADGAEICIQLGKSSSGQGCNTLEQLCLPPAGYPAGTCQTSLFDSKNDCCGLTNITTAAPPPKSPSPKPSPKPPSPTPPCTSCVYVNLLKPTFDPFPFSFDSDSCDAIATVIADSIAAEAEAQGITIIGDATVTCSAYVIKVCGTFANAAATSAALQTFIDNQIAIWYQTVTGTSLGGPCPPYLIGYTTVITVGADGAADPLKPGPSCLKGTGAFKCNPTKVPFPKCQCVTKPFSTPFAAVPVISTQPGFNESTRYCFDIVTVTPQSSVCANEDNLFKIEFWANDMTRRKIQNFYVKPAGASGYSVVAPIWGAYGDETLKCTGLNWSKAQANGASVCMELKKGTKLGDFCKGNVGGTEYCWLNIFNAAVNCCPLYTSALL